MKIEVNTNFLFASTFVNILAGLGLKNACLSPGSRNTPLTLAFAMNKKIKKTVFYDERSTAFFALGISQKTKMPTAVVTTSGTAVAELYPAIIEAFNSRIPLLILTADRPPELHGVGANQTINQENIFANNIRKYFNAGLPDVRKKGLTALRKMAIEAYSIANQGPVHINFPFKKPLEPWNFNDKADERILRESQNVQILNNFKKSDNYKIPEEIVSKINSSERILIFSGGGKFDKDFYKSVNLLSLKLNAPVIADACSPLKFKGSGKNNLLFNSSALLQSGKYFQLLKPDLVLHFGNAPTTSAMLKAYENFGKEKILINEFGDVKDGSGNFHTVLKTNPVYFCNELTKKVKSKKTDRCKRLKQEDEKAENFKRNFLKSTKLKFEGKAIFEIINLLPANSNLFVSNSMPVRDLDYFAPIVKKRIELYTNRGASGIDGINSTAAGIAFASRKETFLITGDLAFLHDLNGLQIAKSVKANLTIFVFNNNGGGIFKLLPVAKEKKYFVKYFQTPHNQNIKKIADAFGAYYLRVSSTQALQKSIKTASSEKGLKIIEITTDAELSTELREKYFTGITENFENGN